MHQLKCPITPNICICHAPPELWPQTPLDLPVQWKCHNDNESLRISAGILYSDYHKQTLMGDPNLNMRRKLFHWTLGNPDIMNQRCPPMGPIKHNYFKCCKIKITEANTAIIPHRRIQSWNTTGRLPLARVYQYSHQQNPYFDTHMRSIMVSSYVH